MSNPKYPTDDAILELIRTADVCGEIGAPCPWCGARSYDTHTEAQHAKSCPWLVLQVKADRRTLEECTLSSDGTDVKSRLIKSLGPAPRLR